jgi:hypothetical protein
LFKTAYQNVAAITKAVSGFPKTGIHALNLDVIQWRGFCFWRSSHYSDSDCDNGCSPSRGGTDSINEKEDTGSSRGVTEPKNETDVVGTSAGDTDCRRRRINIAETLAFPSNSGCQIPLSLLDGSHQMQFSRWWSKFQVQFFFS